MTHEEQQKPQDEPQYPASESTDSHPFTTGLGAVGGSVAGAALGRSVMGGKIGAAVGGVAGAIVGGIAGNNIAEFAEAAIDAIQPSGLGLGADTKPIELPHHYTWEELQALSKPQGRHDSI